MKKCQFLQKIPGKTITHYHIKKGAVEKSNGLTYFRTYFMTEMSFFRSYNDAIPACPQLIFIFFNE